MKKNQFNISLLASIMVSLLVIISSCKKDDNDVAVSDITLTKTATSVAIGETELIGAVFTPSDATNKDLTWRSDNASVATVSEGTVTGVASGTANILAISKSDTTKRATCVVTVTPAETITVYGEITSNQTWLAKNRYKLSGFVYVRNNVTLTIEPGTIIQGISGSKGTLIIERGAKLMAVGTAQKPIVFTSDRTKGSRGPGDWGGVVLCGKAKTNKHDVSTGVGTTEGGTNSQFGGDDDNDNSGTLQYVRIEFAGIALTSVANSEINGLSLYSVGKGTTIDHVQVSYSGDDSYEFFGGAVNCKYMVALGGVDDDYDTDNGYTGNLQFLLSIRDPRFSDVVSGSNGFESDNDADGSILTPTTKPIFSNVTIIGPLAVNATLPTPNYFQRAMHIRRSSQLSVYNSVFVGFPKGLLLDGALGNSPTKAESNDLQIENCILADMGTNFEAAGGTPAVPYTVDQIKAYFEAAARNNKDDATIATTIGAKINLTSPSLLPANGSILLTGASFTNTNLSGNTFFDKTPTYRGAFGATDWTSGWCNFDPQNTDY